MIRPVKTRARYWMSGGLAVVMAALGGNCFAADDRPSAVTSSRYDIIETANRIEASAARHGLSVFTRLRQSPMIGLDGDRRALMIVLECASGGTPVFMDGSSERPGLPLSVLLRVDERGSTQVMIPTVWWEDLPQQLAADVAGMPALVADALLG
ncbi:hypothetical protein BH09PSE5_BH09PSE5_34580 [soil metagenome]